MKEEQKKMVPGPACPNTIVIQGRKFRVEYDSRPVKDVDQFSYVHGQIDYNKRLISIFIGDGAEYDKCGKDVLEILLHEITHATIREFFSLRGCIDTDKTEPFVNDFAGLFADTLIRNGIICADGWQPQVQEEEP